MHSAQAILVVTVSAGLALCSAASATVLEARTVPELVKRADRVDIGVVQSQRTLPAVGELGMTETRVQVERTLLGKPRTSITLSQLGGEVDGVATDLVGDARLAPGQRVLLITWRAPDGRRYLVSMGMGAFVIDGNRVTQEVDAAISMPDGTLQPGPFRRAVSVTEIVRAVGERSTP